MTNKSNDHKSGFTLIELSIVLIIIGLIVGGIITGRSLISGATISSMISQITKYNTAIQAFQMKYSSLPGDFTQASSFIPNAINGNGDGLISSCNDPINAALGGSLSAWGTQGYETTNIWGHLASINLIPGYYVPSNAGYQNLNCTALPAANFDSATCILLYGNMNDLNNYYYITQLNLQIGGWPYQSNSFNPSFSPDIAYGIDKKIDDGNPIAGNVVALSKLGMAATYTGSATLSQSLPSYCIVGTSPSASTGYNTLQNNGLQCNLRILMKL